jgi:hypothetical protein
MRKAIQIVPVFLLAGCASMVAENCADVDWRAAGFEDGARGAPLAEAALGHSRCVNQRMAFDADLYLAGRTEGLAAYCDPANGFTSGAEGEVYRGVCTGPDGATYEAAYRLGRRIFDLKAAAIAADQTVAAAEADLWEIKRRQAIVESALRSSSAGGAERAEHRAELEKLAEDRTRLEGEVAALTTKRTRVEDALSASFTPAIESPEGVTQPLAVSF